MINKTDVLEKLNQAAGILKRSIGHCGVFAGSGARYDHQYWTRDVSLALIPALECLERFRPRSGQEAPDYSPIVRAHLLNLTKRQGKSGAIPILFSDFPELLAAKLRKCTWNGSQLAVGQSFVLKRIFDGMYGDSEQFPEFADFPASDERGLYRLTPGTTDSELLFAYAALEVFGPCGPVRRAVQYLETHYVHDGLHHGADWRDTMEKFFIDKPLLTNNALLYATYKALGDEQKAEALARAIDRTFWIGETYLDYPGSTRFDPLGASLAVLHGLVPPERYDAVLAGFRSVDSPHGVTVKCKHNAYQEGETEVIERTDGVVVWPFVVGFTVLAASTVDTGFALEQFEKLQALDGFAEWYDPANGQKWGEYEQGWSAALYIRAAEKLMPELFN